MARPASPMAWLFFFELPTINGEGVVDFDDNDPYRNQ